MVLCFCLCFRDQCCQTRCDDEDSLFPSVYLDLEEGEDSRELIEFTLDSVDDNVEAKEEDVLMAEQRYCSCLHVHGTYSTCNVESKI